MVKNGDEWSGTFMDGYFEWELPPVLLRLLQLVLLQEAKSMGYRTDGVKSHCLGRLRMIILKKK